MTKTTIENRLEYYDNLIPVIFPKNFPQGFELRPTDWVLTPQVVSRPNVTTTIDGVTKSIRPIGTMDIELLSNATIDRARMGEVNLVTNYPCEHKCPGCFSQDDTYKDANRLLKWQHVMSVLDDAQKIGLTSVKFLGPGELFQNPDLFDILDAFEARKLPISVFTKGAELGDDELASRHYGHLGIKSSKDLVNKVTSYDSVRILLGFNSLLKERQDAIVGSSSVNTSYVVEKGASTRRGIFDYTTKRDRALVNLTQAGLNDPRIGQRLTLVMAPLYPNQVDEVDVIYEWAARRNMPIVITPTMESGPKSLKLAASNLIHDSENAWIKDAIFKVYSRCIDLGIHTIPELEQKGISPYFGVEGCNQVANGLMMRLNGQIKICPGSSRPSHIYGNIHDASIAKLWVESKNYLMGPLQNNWCLAKQQGLPYSLQNHVLHQLKEKYAGAH